MWYLPLMIFDACGRLLQTKLSKVVQAEAALMMLRVCFHSTSMALLASAPSSAKGAKKSVTAKVA